MWFIPKYILILAITIIIDYAAGILIEKTSTRKKKRLYLVISIISTCMVLFIFKYFNFFNTNFANIAYFLHLNYPLKTLEVALPIGLSFHTFQSLSYVIEVYRGKQKAEYNFGIYALYVMFYPQLVAGPIERPQNLLHQFYEKHFFDYKRITDGLKLMIWGLFKKMVIADRLAVSVNAVYSDPIQYNGLGLITATIFFAFQIYCDFSGYSDIAVGSAQVMGFKLMNNFNLPYFSKSISEFWSKWHISLSTWFKDYLYIPMGGSHCKMWKWYFNLFFVFLVSGLWHGANWTYIIWGSINGLFIIFSIWTKKLRLKIITITKLNQTGFFLKCLRVFITFSLICFSWIFFRAKNINDAFYIITHLTNGWGDILLRLKGVKQSPWFGATLALNQDQLVIVIISITLLIAVQIVQRTGEIKNYLNNYSVYIRWPLWYLSIFVLIFLGIQSNLITNDKFIYFQF
ncbi:MAG: Membrane bound O-acyl transferase MBOAT family protein [uncultured bacterium]|nr:MAG: Membrane bound O-acyl transferase MBOAT family protein [uncultured bacterium]